MGEYTSALSCNSFSIVMRFGKFNVTEFYCIYTQLKHQIIIYFFFSADSDDYVVMPTAIKLSQKNINFM